MRHRNAGFKLGRNTSHRRAMLRNLVTSVILMDRVETTIPKCKATRPIIEKMITLGKRGTVHALPDIIEGPVVFLSVDTPRRDPKDIIFVNPEDGTPESFVHGLKR